MNQLQAAQQLLPPTAQDLEVKVCKMTIQYSSSDGIQHPIKYRAFLKETNDFGNRPLFISQRAVYRFVHSDLDAVENFLPVGLLPPRIQKAQQEHKKACNFSLSVYVTEQQMRSKFAELKNDYPMIINRIGDHFTSFLINKEAGCHTLSGYNGHLELHENEAFIPKINSATPVRI